MNGKILTAKDIAIECVNNVPKSITCEEGTMFLAKSIMLAGLCIQEGLSEIAKTIQKSKDLEEYGMQPIGTVLPD